MSTPGYGPSQIAAEALRRRLLVTALLLDIRTAQPVEVLDVQPGAGSPPSIGTVTVQPLVQTVLGGGTLQSLPPVYDVPFCRQQSGSTALVMDPTVGDIGIAVSCDRDISAVLAAAGLAGPGSACTHSISDMVYLLSIISAAEITQYIQCLANGGGITIKSPGNILVNNATITPAGEIIDANGVSLGNHTHLPGTLTAPSGGGPVTGDTGAPIAS